MLSVLVRQVWKTYRLFSTPKTPPLPPLSNLISFSKKLACQLNSWPMSIIEELWNSFIMLDKRIILYIIRDIKEGERGGNI